MLSKNRPPNWAFWRLKPFVMAFEAAALSLNIEPKTVRYSCPGDVLWIFNEDQDFKDRVELICANVGAIEGQAQHPDPADPDKDISLSRFVDWALLRAGWDMPPELRALGNENHASSISTPVTQHHPPTDRTGYGGRPTSKHLIEEEFQRRIDAGAIESTISDQAENLIRWFESMPEHQGLRVPAQTSVENAIRLKYHAARDALFPEKLPQNRPQNRPRK